MPTLRNTVKTWFETGDYPTQAQFWELFDSIFFKEDGIAIGDVAGLQTALDGKAAIAALQQIELRVVPNYVSATGNHLFNVPPGLMVDKVAVKVVQQTTLRIGTTSNGQEILEDTVLVTGKWHVINLDYFVGNTPGELHLFGIINTTELYFFKR